MRKIFLVILFFTAPVFLSCSSQNSAPSSNPPRVLIIGDSISLGYTPYVVRMLQGEAVVEHHEGNAGPTLRGLKNIDAWLGDTQWDVIHFNWGLWDMYGWSYEAYDQSPTAYEKNLETLVLRLKKTGAKLIWATTMPACPGPEKKCKVIIDPATEKQYLDAAARVMKKYHIQVNDMYSFMAPKREQYAIADNDVHYTADGYKALAKQVADEIKSVIESKPWKR